METFNEIIESSRDIIRQEMRKNYLSLALTIEEFLVNERVPVEPDFSENEPYKYTCYPDTNFLEIVNKVRSELIPKLTEINGKVYTFIPYIYKYIMILSVDNKALLQITNMFYPVLNYKFLIKTYAGESRFPDSKAKLFYVHPKYKLDLIFSRLYDPLADHELELSNYYKTYEQWGEIDLNKNSAKSNKSLKRNGIKEYKMVKNKVILCNHDMIYTSCLCYEKDLDEIIKTIDPKRSYTVSRNIVKSLYDMRYYNTTLSIGGKTIIKFWPVLEYSLIPMIDKYRAHINVVIHYCLIDYLHNDIMNIEKVAYFKNLILNYYIDRKTYMIKKHILVRLDKCQYKGVYYPIEIYLKQHRIDKMIEMIENKKKDDNITTVMSGRYKEPHLLTL